MKKKIINQGYGSKAHLFQHLAPPLISVCRFSCYEQCKNPYIMLNPNSFPVISYTVPPIKLIHLAPCYNTHKEEQEVLSNIILFLFLFATATTSFALGF